MADTQIEVNGSGFATGDFLRGGRTVRPRCGGGTGSDPGGIGNRGPARTRKWWE